VPYFELNDRYAISGAQPAEFFSSALNKAWSEWQKEAPAPLTANNTSAEEAAACSAAGNCD
jgi:hypothetical protein